MQTPYTSFNDLQSGHFGAEDVFWVRAMVGARIGTGPCEAVGEHLTEQRVVVPVEVENPDALWTESAICKKNGKIRFG